MIDAWKVTVKLDFFVFLFFHFSLSPLLLYNGEESSASPDARISIKQFQQSLMAHIPAAHIRFWFILLWWENVVAKERRNKHSAQSSNCMWVSGMTFLGKSLIETFRHDSTTMPCMHFVKRCNKANKWTTNDCDWKWNEGSMSRMQNRLLAAVCELDC